MSVNGSGAKRPNPYLLESQPDAKIARDDDDDDDSGSQETSETEGTRRQKEILSELTATLRRKDLDLNAPENRDLMHLLTCVAKGSVTDVEPDDAEDVFIDLLAAHEYKLFAATFNRYHRLLEEAVHRQPDAPPHRRSLTLCFATDWNPELVELTQVLNEIDVDCVRVRPPSPWEPVGMATCLCVATLLNAGASELHLQGDLSTFDLIVSAISVSALRDISLSRAPLLDASTEAEVTGYRRILKALAHCPTLEHLQLGYPELLEIHADVGDVATQGGPALKAITVGYLDGYSSLDIDNRPTFPAFLDMAVKIPTLTSFTTRRLSTENGETLKHNVLEPLGRNKSLTHLDLEVIIRTDTVQSKLQVAPRMLAFKRACPSLTHLRMDAGRLGIDLPGKGRAGQYVDRHLRQGGSLTEADPSVVVDKPMASESSELAFLALHGLPLAPDFSDTLFLNLQHDTSLQGVDLRDCFLAFRSKKRALEALELNQTLHAFLIPQTLENYFFLLDEDPPRAAGFPNIFDSSYSHLVSVSLVMPAGASPEQTARANAQQPELIELNQQLIDVVENKTVRNQQARLAPAAHQQLVPRVQGFLSEALKSAAGGRDVASGGFGIPAGYVLQHLWAEAPLRSAVHLAEVSRRSDGDGLHKKERFTPGEALKSLATGQMRKDAEEKHELAHDQSNFRQVEAPLYSLPHVPRRPAVPAQLAFQMGVQLNPRDADLFQTAVMATTMGESDRCKQMIEAGAPVNVVDRWGSNELLVMVKDPDLVHLLRLKGACDYQRHAEYLANGCLPSVRLNEQQSDLHRVALRAAQSGGHELLLRAFELGAPVNVVDEAGDNILLSAARAGEQHDTVDLLLRLGAPENALPSEPPSPLAQAFREPVGSTAAIATSTTTTTTSTTATTLTTTTTGTARAGTPNGAPINTLDPAFEHNANKDADDR